MGYKRGDVIRTAFDAYAIERLRGEGGSGEVYEARDSEGAAYAVKVLNSEKATAGRLKRFKNEIHFCTKNSHPNVIHVEASGVTPRGETFYVMPLYSGTLRDLISNGIAEGTVLRYFGQILDGVEAAHLQGVWHRDVKPENILFSGQTDLLVVADFGIAHFEEEDLLTAVETRNNERLGNFLYSAPEQRNRGQRVDGKSDVYALGVVLNEMFTKAVPQGTSFRTVSEIAPQYGYLDELIDLMLRQDPAARPSIQDVKRELISRGNEFLSLQRLNSLKSQVIPETDVDDPVVKTPIAIADTDFRDGLLVFKLTATPPSNWIMAFHNPGKEFSFYQGAGPPDFSFSRNEACVRLGAGMSAARLAANARSYVELANERYSEIIVAEKLRQLREDREQLRRKVEQEEHRQKILRELRAQSNQ